MGGDGPEVEEAEEVARRVKGKHDTGDADLAKVTDFAEEKEVAVSASDVTHLLHPHPAKAKAEKILIRKDDVEILMRELELSKQAADRKLREHRGDLKAAIKDVLAL